MSHGEVLQRRRSRRGNTLLHFSTDPRSISVHQARVVSQGASPPRGRRSRVFRSLHERPPLERGRGSTPRRPSWEGQKNTPAMTIGRGHLLARVGRRGCQPRGVPQQGAAVGEENSGGACHAPERGLAQELAPHERCLLEAAFELPRRRPRAGALVWVYSLDAVPVVHRKAVGQSSALVAVGRPTQRLAGRGTTETRQNEVKKSALWPRSSV